LRSLLLLRAADSLSRQEMFDSGADALALDLAGADRGSARIWARELIEGARASSLPAGRPGIYVLCGPADAAETDADLHALIGAAPDGFLLAGAESGASVQHFAAKLAVAEAIAGRPDGATGIIAIAAQTPVAALSLKSFPRCSRRLAGLVFDGATLASAMSLPPHAPPVAATRAQVAIAAAAAGVPAIDGPTLAGTGEGLAAACRRARRYGYSGKIAASAPEVATISTVFGAAIDKRP
jgi:citrate lyase subunit beta/citryl-CoA lyase